MLATPLTPSPRSTDFLSPCLALGSSKESHGAVRSRSSSVCKPRALTDSHFCPATRTLVVRLRDYLSSRSLSEAPPFDRDDQAQAGCQPQVWMIIASWGWGGENVGFKGSQCLLIYC